MFDWLDDAASAVVEFGGEVGTAVVNAADWVVDAVDSVFGEGVGVGIFTGAALGGLTAALTGEDIVDGALIGGAAGGVIGGVGHATGVWGGEEAAEAPAPVITAEETVSDMGGVAKDITEGTGGYSITDFEIEAPEYTYDGDGFTLLDSPADVAKMTPAAAMVTNGFNKNTGFLAGYDITNRWNLDSSQFVGVKDVAKEGGTVFDKIGSFWGDLAKSNKQAIIGSALTGGAAVYLQDKKLDRLEEMREKEYQRNKAKVGSVRAQTPGFRTSPKKIDASRGGRAYSTQGLLS